MSSGEEDFGSYDEDVESSTSSSQEESGTESHEVRMTVVGNLLDKFKGLPLKASVDFNVHHTVSLFHEQNFMPPGTRVEVEELPREDEEGEEEWLSYLVWRCEKYEVEVHAHIDDPSSLSVRVLHLPARRIVNVGYIWETKDITEMCKFLEKDSFHEAMRLLFRRYGGGNKDGQLRTQEILEWVATESSIRSTTSGFEL